MQDYEELAALYALGLLTGDEKRAFEHVLIRNRELLQIFKHLCDVQAAVMKAEANRMTLTPAPGLKNRLLQKIGQIQQMRLPGEVLVAFNEALLPYPQEREAVVYACPEGYLKWACPGFTRLCGYTLEELKGRKPGPMLQGPETDPASAEALHLALQNRKPLVQRMVNYHRSGASYVVEIDLRPVSNGFIALERECEAA